MGSRSRVELKGLVPTTQTQTSGTDYSHLILDPVIPGCSTGVLSLPPPYAPYSGAGALGYPFEGKEGLSSRDTLRGGAEEWNGVVGGTKWFALQNIYKSKEIRKTAVVGDYLGATAPLARAPYFFFPESYPQ